MPKLGLNSKSLGRPFSGQGGVRPSRAADFLTISTMKLKFEKNLIKKNKGALCTLKQRVEREEKRNSKKEFRGRAYSREERKERTQKEGLDRSL